MEFHDLKVSKVERQTEDCVSVTFEMPADLKAKYDFIPGQYLTLDAEIDGKRARRSYSICSGEHEDLQVAIKRIEGGVFSTWANSKLKAGTVMRVARPEGNFVHQANATNQNEYVAFVAGSGITPVLSIMKSVLTSEPKSSFILFYGNKRTTDIIFREQIEALKNTYMDRLQVYYILSKGKTETTIFSGRISADKCPTYFKYFIPGADITKVFLCGPYDMIMSMKAALLLEGVAAEKIKFELFYNPEADKNIKNDEVAKVVEHERIVKITLDGLTSEIKSNYDIAILDMAIEAGLDLPFSCKGGVCATCKAKIVEGKVKMTTNYALEEDEVKNGYILTCQSHVKTNFVHVNFDA
jgi:ring-1,2-phenylacetyl-CoA epoxidase subunit PaaE